MKANDVALTFRPTCEVIDLFKSGRLIPAFARSFVSKKEFRFDEFRSNRSALFYVNDAADHKLMIRVGRDHFEIDYDVNGQLAFKAVYESNASSCKRSYYWKSGDLHDNSIASRIMNAISYNRLD